MKKNYIIIPVAIAALGLFAFQKSGTTTIETYLDSHLQSGGGQAVLTGAPGEGNCTQCHVGSVLDGNSTNEHQFGVYDVITEVTTYLPGQTYNIRFQKTSDPAKQGFSATALDGLANMAGSFNGDATFGETQAFSSGGRDYVSHTVNSNTNAPMFWLWTWTAPATNVGDVTFYIASNSANNNGATSGDEIYLSTHTVSVDPTIGIDENEKEETSFEAGYSPSSHAITVDFNSLTSGDMYFNLVDLNGKSVFTYDLDNAMIGDNHEMVSLPESIKNGIYVVHYFIGNKAMSANVMVQR